MKILIDFQDTIGGAPRSLKEHALLLKQNGHEIIAVIAEKEYGDFFDNTGFEVSHLPRFYTKYLFKNINLIYKYCKLIKQKNIDIIYTNRVLQSLFLSIVSDVSKVPILNARAGGFGISETVKTHKDKHYIVYSEENLKTFRKFGFSENKLYLLRNRIPIPNTKHVNDLPPNNEIIITVTGSIKQDTLNGILWLLTYIEEIVTKAHMKYQINFAGGNILKTDEEKTKFKKALSHAQQALPSNLKISHLGWVNNITVLQAQSHICIGKGRSVIQPAMLGKISFVISEKGTLYRCKQDNYNDLLYYNFSGRGIINEENNSLSEFKELLSNNNSYLKYQKEAKVLVQKFKEDYATEYAQDKLEEIIRNVKSSQRIQFGIFRGLKKLVLLYTFTIMNRIRKTNH
jgi:hypothetical protein